jgi:ankyrin repeat protein
MNVVRLLVNRGANLSAKDCQDQSLFQVASRNGKPALFFALMEAGLDPTLEDIYSWYTAGQRQVWMASNHMGCLVAKPDFLLRWCATLRETRAMFNLVPSYYRKLNLTCRCRWGEVCCTALYNASTAGVLDIVKLLHGAGAMLNLEGGLEGTPLMGACKAGRLDVVKYFVRNGALLNYEKHGVHVSAFDKAASYPKVQRWLLVERFIDQRMILDGGMTGEHVPSAEENNIWTDEIADITLDLVLEDDVERYLESKNWFLPLRRFFDDGQGAFVRVSIMPEEFARYRPLDFKVLVD